MKINKKGLMDDVFDFFSLVLAGFFLLLFFGVILGQVAENSRIESLNNVGRLQADTNLLFYLNSPAEVGTMADLIGLWYHNRSYEDQLVKASEKILSQLPAPFTSSGWNVRIKEGDDELLHITTYNIVGDYENRNMVFPLKMEEKELKIEIYLECEDVRCQ